MNETNLQTKDSSRKLFFKICGGVALLLEALFLIGIISLIVEGPQPSPLDSSITLLQNNWLIKLFERNSGIGGIQSSALYIINPLDIVILILFGILFLGLYVALSHTSKIWSAIVTSFPLLGIILFLATASVGRSNLLIGGIIYSCIMLRSNIFSKATASMGLVGSTLLFIADLTSAGFFSVIVAIIISIGYILWLLWLPLIGWKLIHLN